MRTALLASLLLLGVALLSCGRRAGSVGPAPDTGGQEAPLTARATVVVVAPEEGGEVARVVISPRQAVLTPGGRAIFTAVALDAGGRPVQGAQVVWRVRDPRAGSITSTGLFRAGESPGLYPDAVEAVVQAGGARVTARATVQVVERGAASLRIGYLGVSARTVTARPGQRVGLAAWAYDPRGRVLPNVRFTWRMADPSAGTVDQFGLFQAGEVPGKYPRAIVATAHLDTPEGEETRETYISVVISPRTETGALSRVVVIPERVVLAPGEEVRFIARAVDQSGQPVEGVEFSWSAQEGAGTMRGPGLFVAGQEEGYFLEGVRVVATQQGPAGELQATAVVPVRVERSTPRGRVVGARLVPSSPLLRPGQTILFIANGLDEAGLVVPAQVRWEVADPRAGTLKGPGLFQAGDTPGIYPNALRAVVLTPGGGQVEAYATVNILGPVQRLEVQPSRAVVPTGGTVQFRAMGYDANGLPISDLVVEWRVADPRAGSIDPSGLFTAGERPGEYPGAVEVSVKPGQ